MKKLIIILSTAFSFILASHAAYADTSLSALTSCLTKSTSEDDKKQLTTWLFTSMQQNPDMQTIATIEAKTIEQQTEKTGALFNRLLTKDCANEVNAAIEASNTNKAMQTAFHHLGRLAMQSMMANPSVGKAMSNPSKYIELDKLGL